MKFEESKEKMLLNAFLDPNVAYVVLVLAFVITVLALFAPGTGVLEIAALAVLMASGYSIANMPVNSWALPAVLIGTVLVILSIRRNVKWYVLALAVLLIVGGTAFLFKNETRIFSADPLLTLLVSAGLGAFIWIIGHNAHKAFNQKAHRDLAGLVGMSGRAVTDIHQNGSVYAAGEEWSAESDTPIRSGSNIRVIARKGFVLKVEVVKTPQIKQ